MNFLAHLFLSNKDPNILIGNFIADFIRNHEVGNYSSEIQKGILLHRKIDSFTDNHPLVRQGTARLQPVQHKYAPVVIDILYDYLLAKNWDTYTDEPLRKFSNWAYQVLESNLRLMPERLQKRVPKMVDADWLMAYGTEKGMRFTFEKMSDRTSFPSYFDSAFDQLLEDFDKYNNEFNSFFPEVMEMVNEDLKLS